MRQFLSMGDGASLSASLSLLPVPGLPPSATLGYMSDSTAWHRHTTVACLFSGAIATLAGFAAGEVFSLVNGALSPLTTMGDSVIDLSGPSLTRWAIDTFGTANKTILQSSIIATVLVTGAILGVLWKRHRRIALTILIGLTVLVGIAAYSRPNSTGMAGLPTLAAGAATLLVLWALVRQNERSTEPDAVRTDRRRFLLTASAIAVGSTVIGWWSRHHGLTTAVEEERAGVDLPEPAEPAPQVANPDFPSVDDLTRFHTDNASFYQIDTAISPPRIKLDDFRIRVHGMVDHELTLTFEDLLARRLVERDITLCCVSNEIGGNLVGNARWLGVPLSEVLDEAGVHSGADQLVSRSQDGWTAGSPTSLIMDGRDALIALGMNGEPLPLQHGWPARIVVPGLYGYVSATKWVTELELTTFDAYDAYWIKRDWALPSPIKTSSRIDTPRKKASAGDVTVAGVAWAQSRGIEKVEIQVDDGEWNRAELATVPSPDTWRLWQWDWKKATKGKHTLTVRATDGDGNIQTSTESSVIPDGATGHHSITVDVV